MFKSIFIKVFQIFSPLRSGPNMWAKCTTMWVLPVTGYHWDSKQRAGQSGHVHIVHLSVHFERGISHWLTASAHVTFINWVFTSEWKEFHWGVLIYLLHISLFMFISQYMLCCRRVALGLTQSLLNCASVRMMDMLEGVVDGCLVERLAPNLSWCFYLTTLQCRLLCN